MKADALGTEDQGESAAGALQKHRAQMSQSVNAGQRTSKQSLLDSGGTSPPEIKAQVRVRNKY